MSRSPSPLPVPVIKALCIGQEFDNFKSFKTAMQDWALSNPRKFTFRFKKSDRTRNTVVSVHADSTGCPFKVNATYSVAMECVTVVGIEEEHNCTGVRPVERSSSSRQNRLQRVLPTTITTSKATTTAMIRDAVISATQSSTSNTATQRSRLHCAQPHSCCYGRHLHISYASRRFRSNTSATTARAVGMPATSIQKLEGRPQTTARITAREQRARRAAHAGALPDIPNRIQRCREEGHNVLNCALPEGM